MAGEGSSVGSLLIALRADYSDLKTELDKAKQRLADFEAGVRKTSDGAKQSFDKMAMSAETIKRSFGNVATGVLLMTGAFDKAGAAGQVLQQTLGAYMAGGPLAAGVSLLSGGFKLLSEAVSESGRAAEEASKKHKQALEEIEKRSKATRDEIQQTNDAILRVRLKGLGVDLPGGVIEKERTAGQLREQAAAEEHRANTLRRLIELQSQYDDAYARRNRLRFNSGERDEIRRAEQEMETLRKRIQTVYEGAGIDAVDRRSSSRRFLASDVDDQIKKIDELVSKWRAAAAELEEASDGAATLANETERVGEATKAAADPMDDFWNAIEKFRNGEAGEAMEAWAKDLQKAKDEAARVAEELRKIDEHSQAQADAAEAIVRDYDLQRQATEKLTDEERDRLEVTRKIEELLNSGRIGVDHAERVYSAMMAALKGARELRQLEEESRKSKAEAEKADRDRKAALERAAGANKGIDDEIAMLRAVTDEQRKQVELAQRIAELRKQGASEERIAALIAATAQREAYDRAAAAREKALEEWRSFGRTMDSVLSSSITEGFANGFRNAEDILKNFVNQALRAVSGSIANQLVGGIGGGGGLFSTLLGGLFGGGGGGGGGVSQLIGAIGGGSSSVGSVGGMLSGLLGGGAVGDCPG